MSSGPSDGQQRPVVASHVLLVLAQFVGVPVVTLRWIWRMSVGVADRSCNGMLIATACQHRAARA
jgi:hypothetical protein